MNRKHYLTLWRHGSTALGLAFVLTFYGCVPVTTISTGGVPGAPPADADFALQKLTVEGAEFVPLVKGADGRLRAAYAGRDFETTNNLAASLNLTPADDWWLRNDESVAPTIRRHIGEYINEDGVITTCDTCAFGVACLNGGLQIPANPSFDLQRSFNGELNGPVIGVNLLNICQTRRRSELTLSADEILSLTGVASSEPLFARLLTHIAHGPRQYVTAPLILMPGGNAPARYYFAMNAADPASLPAAGARWAVNFSPNLPARALRAIKQGGGQSVEGVSFSRVNAVIGCITGYDLSGNPIYNLGCVTPERHKCAPPASGDGSVNLADTAACPRGSVLATPTYFLENGFSPQDRVFWVIEFDGGAPALAPGQSLSLSFTL